jgi:parallel beta-helix repeat protein
MRKLSRIPLNVLVIMFVLAIPASSYAAEGKIMIGQTPSTTFPIVIDIPGSYVLTSNLQVSTNLNCIQISADNVTLDLNGFALTGPGTGSGGYGIYLSGYKNITVMNGTVRDFMGSGIYFLSSTKIQLKDLKCSNNGQNGIYVGNATVINCIAEENGTDGIRAYYATVKDCAANDNTDDGFNVLSSTVLNVQAYSNDNRGIYSRRSSLTNCTTTFSGDHGIEAYDSTVTNCTSYNNTTEHKNGIYLTDSIATNCTANGSHVGFRITNTTLTNCTANMNDFRGFNVLSNSTLTNCTANGNYDHGFYIADSSVVTNCTATNNGMHGIWVGRRNRIEGNNVRYNGHLHESGYGIRITSTLSEAYNYVIKNTASDNYGGNFYNINPDNYMPLTGDDRNYGF